MQSLKAVIAGGIVGIFGALLGFFLVPFQDLWTDKIRSPDISIEFGMKQPYYYYSNINPIEVISSAESIARERKFVIVLQKEEVVEETDKKIEKEKVNKEKDRFKAFFFRFGIKNNSRLTTASKCQAFITNIWHMDKAEKFVEDESFEPIKLQMYQLPGKYESQVDISPEMQVFSFLGRIAEPEHQLKYDKGLSGDVSKPQFQIIFDSTNMPSWIKTNLSEGIHRLKVQVYFGNRAPIHKTFEINWSGEWQPDFEKMKKAISVKLM